MDIEFIKQKICEKMARHIDDVYDLGQAKMDIHDMLLTMMRIDLLTADDYLSLESYLDDYFHLAVRIHSQL